jgi:superfamily I DNA/RNA helicase
MRDEMETLATFAARIAPAGDHADMVLGELAGDGEHLDRLTLSTLHSAKGREFGVVFMFGMGARRPPHANDSNQSLELSSGRLRWTSELSLKLPLPSPCASGYA